MDSKATRSLNKQSVGVVAVAMYGKRREKFLASVAVINESLAQGAWIKRGSAKADVGFYQGLESKQRRMQPFRLEMCVNYGQAFAEELTDEMCTQTANPRVLRAWVSLCSEVAAARKLLDAARPRPVVTAIGLSPKVTKTFQECNLDLDSTTIAPAEIERCEVQRRHSVTGEPCFTAAGVPEMEVFYRVKWSTGIALHVSRFSYSNGCEACGKSIPSGRFVPIEADCRKLGKRIGMWVGCDCARNIFGIKDIGIGRTEAV